MAAFADTTVLTNAGNAKESECTPSLDSPIDKVADDDTADTVPALPVAKGIDELTLSDSVTPKSVVLDGTEAAEVDIGGTEFSHKMFQRHIEDFECEHCGERVSGNGYTNRKTCNGFLGIILAWSRCTFTVRIYHSMFDANPNF